MLRRTCAALKSSGARCRANPLRESDYCLMHDPEHAEEVSEARKLGGLRKRREAAVIGAYDLEGLDTLEFLQRVLAIALLDTLGQDNSLNRSRTLGYLVGIGTKLRQEGETEERLRALEAAVQGQQMPAESVFDVGPGDDGFFSEGSYD
jgi:hypothetical protein